MKRILSPLSAGIFFTLVSAVALSSCASAPQTQIASNADPKSEIDRTESLLQDARQKQFDQLAQKNFSRAEGYLSSAKKRLEKNDSQEKILRDLSMANFAIGETNRIGSAYAPGVQSVLNARSFAIAAQAPKFQTSKFEDADEDLADMSDDMENNNFRLNSEDLTNLEKKYNEIELSSRKHALLNETKQWISQAEKNGAKSKTPSLLEEANTKLSAADNSITVNMRNPAAYAGPVAAASQSARKLSEVLALAIKNDASEIVAFALWTKNQQLTASQAALTKSGEDMKAADLEAQKEKGALQTQIADNEAAIDNQERSISSLQSQNKLYANEEELKQRIEELKKTFSSDEADVLKDGNRLIVRLKKMEFASGRAELNPNSMDTLKKVENLIAAVPATSVIVEGHTDSTGSDRTNNNLSEQRAETVKKYLSSQGLEDDMKINAMGFGSNKPITSNKTKTGRAANRRVDIVIETPAVL